MTKSKKNIFKKHYNNRTRKKITKALNGNEELSIVQFNNIDKSIMSRSKKTNKEIRSEFIKSFETPYSDLKYKANNDFYRFINMLWVEKQIKQYSKENTKLLKKDNFLILQHNVNKQLNAIIQNFLKDQSTSVLAKSMKPFYNSLKTYGKKKTGLHIAEEATKKLDELRGDKSNIYKLLGLINQNEFIKTYCPLYWLMSANVEENNKFACHVMPHKLPFYHAYVFDDKNNDAFAKKHKKEKYNFVSNVFTAILGKGNHKAMYDNFVNVEKKLYKVYAESLNLQKKPFVKITREEAIRDYNFNWDAFAKEIGFKEVPSFFFTSNINYISNVMKLLENEWNSEEWRPFWLMIFYRFLVRYTKEWRHIYFNYHGKFLLGFSGDWFHDLAFQSVLLMAYPFTNSLSNFYCDEYRNLKAERFTKTLAEDLRDVFIRMLERNTWLSTNTKNYAIHKIKKLKFVIGHQSDDYAQERFPDAILDYSNDDLLENLIKVNNYKLEKCLHLNGTKYFDLSFIDWESFPFQLTGRVSFIVNAFYSVFENSITISVGYLQPPFLDLKDLGLEFNLATIGFTIAHEMSHALDSIGGHYDANGNQKNWWSAKDLKKYKAIQDDVLNEYETFAKRDNFFYDAHISLAEDLADISGLAICEEYLRDYIQTKNIIKPIRYLSFRKFYDYFAYNLRQFIPRKMVQTLMLVNPHPPDVYRVNVPLTRSSIFRAAFNVKKGDGMWWHNTNVIW